MVEQDRAIDLGEITTAPRIEVRDGDGGRIELRVNDGPWLPTPHPSLAAMVEAARPLKGVLALGSYLGRPVRFTQHEMPVVTLSGGLVHSVEKNFFPAFGDGD